MNLKHSLLTSLLISTTVISSYSTPLCVAVASSESQTSDAVHAEGLQADAELQAHIHSDLLPRALPLLHVIGKNKNFYVGLGGAVKGTAGCDFGHVLDNPNEFIVSSLPMEQPAGDGGKFQISAQQTELFILAGFNPGDKNEVMAYLNGCFLGDNYGFRIDNAYLSFRGFTAGYGYGLFCDTWAAPATIDYQGPNALITVTSGIFDYRHKFGIHWTAGVGVEMPIASFTTAEGSTRSVNQRIPDVPLMVEYKCDNGTRIGAAAMFRGLQYRNEVADKNKSVCGWGVRLSGNGTLFGPLDFFFQGSYGKGIASYIQDLNELGMDLVPCSAENGCMAAVEAYGIMGGLQYNFLRKSLLRLPIRMSGPIRNSMRGATLNGSRCILTASMR